MDYDYVSMFNDSDTKQQTEQPEQTEETYIGSGWGLENLLSNVTSAVAGAVAGAVDNVQHFMIPQEEIKQTNTEQDKGSGTTIDSGSNKNIRENEPEMKSELIEKTTTKTPSSVNNESQAQGTEFKQEESDLIQITTRKTFKEEFSITYALTSLRDQYKMIPILVSILLIVQCSFTCDMYRIQLTRQLTDKNAKLIPKGLYLAAVSGITIASLIVALNVTLIFRPSKLENSSIIRLNNFLTYPLLGFTFFMSLFTWVFGDEVNGLQTSRVIFAISLIVLVIRFLMLQKVKDKINSWLEIKR